MQGNSPELPANGRHTGAVTHGRPKHPDPVLPVGTQVVARQTLVGVDGAAVQRGATGRVSAVTTDGSYVVQLPTGREVLARRAELGLRRGYQTELGIGVRTDDGPDLVREHTILACVVGSRAFGLATADSDSDVRGVFVAPTATYWHLLKPPTHVDEPASERFSWEVERFCELALKANPNMLEVLTSPLRETVTPLGEELLALRRAFFSQLVYQTFSGYVLGQFKKIEGDLRRDGAPKWKHVMHLLRLLISAGDLLRTGELALDVGAHRERLLAIKGGGETWQSVEEWRLSLHAQLDDALDVTPLPPVPDVRSVDDWLYDVRRRSALDLPS